MKDFEGRNQIWDDDLVVTDDKGVETKQAGLRDMTPEENTDEINKFLASSRAVTFGNTIYINADTISGKTTKEVVDEAVQLALFHEPVAHVGLKNYLTTEFGPEKYESFLCV